MQRLPVATTTQTQMQRTCCASPGSVLLVRSTVPTEVQSVAEHLGATVLRETAWQQEQENAQQ